MDTTVVLNSFPKTYIFITAFFISIKINFHTLFIVAMVTKFRSLSLLYDFFAMETTVVLDNFPKSKIVVSTFLLVSKATFIQFCLLLWLPNSIIQADSVILEIAVVLIIFFFVRVTAKFCGVLFNDYSPYSTKKRHEMYMPNAKTRRQAPNATYIPLEYRLHLLPNAKKSTQKK